MESPRDPLPADVSAEPEPAVPPPAEATGPQAAQPAARSAARSAAQSAAQSTAGPEPAAAVPRPRDPGEPTEPLRLGEPAESLPPGTPAEPLRLGEPAESLPSGDADLIAASRAGDAAAYDTLYRRHVAAAHSLARQLVRNRAEADDVVAETFAKILDLLHRGGGPDDAFRPYLLTAVRRAAYDRHRAERRQLVTGEMETFDRGVPFADPAVADLERTMIARAFASLPERWQAVLWHTEIEGARPADVAPLLGLTANGVAALAYRAREGLRQAYLQMHLSGTVRDECRPVAAKLGAYVRGGLAKREAAVVGAHLDQCAECRRVFAELGDVNVALKGIVAPIVLGPATAAYLASAAGKGSAGAWIAGRLGWLRHAPKGQQAAAAGVAAATVVGLAAAALALTGHSGPAPAHHALPPTAAGAPAQGASSSSGPSSSASHHPGSGPSAPGSGAPGSAPGAPGPGAPGPASGAPGSVPGAPGSAPAASAPSQPGQASAPTEPATAPGSQPAAAAPAPSSAAPGSAPTSASPSTAPVPQAQIAARINPVGTLSQGATGIVGFSVDNTGSGPAATVTANVSLPLGVSLLAGGTLGRASMDRSSPGGWTCAPVGGGATCTHGPLAANASTTSYLQVVVAADAPPGQPPAISVDGGGRRATAHGTAGVSAGGFPARFAASGRYAVTTAGARLGGDDGDCDGTAEDNSAWDMQPAPPRCPAGRPGGTPADRPGSSPADRPGDTVALSGPVVWAGLYWAWTGGPSQAAIALRAPGGPARQVTGAAATAPLDLGFHGLARVPVHQAFADVTGLVAQYGSGAWSASAPAPVGWPRGPQAAEADGAGYLGWTLVVVTGDPAAPPGQVMVLDAVRPVDAAHYGFSVPLDGLLAGQVVRVHAVGWTVRGPRSSAFTQPLAAHPAVTFPAANAPYLVGVITAAAPLVPPAPEHPPPRCLALPGPAPAGPVRVAGSCQ
jgi:RNA polymerase sigma factor (sigma-70 family)